MAQRQARCREAWRAWEEATRSATEYVATSAKGSGGIRGEGRAAALFGFDSLNEGWKSATKMHFGGIALVEYAAVLAELKMARFELNGSWRNMATFG